jgi:PAS domain S-box-containing protein
VDPHAGGVQHTFEPHPVSVGDARHLVREQLVAAGRDDLVEAAELAVTELVTNALVHAGTRIGLRTHLDADGLRVEVTDGSAQFPTRRRNGTLAGTGRGLMIVDSTVDRWGVDTHPAGKTVWFELSSAEGTHDAPRDVQVLGRDDEHGSVRVELRNVPLLLHVAWQQHAESLLREFLLLSLTEGAEEAGLQAHAASSDAIALVLDHLPDPNVGDDPDILMAAVSEPEVSSESEVLVVPLASLAHFRALDETLDAALALADEGKLLTAPTQPEIRAFRRWICGEVDRQSRGEVATAWVDSDEAGPPMGWTPLDWASEVVTASDEALIAADDANGIVAVSRPALDLLGYDDAAELLGRRLVGIIPQRLRQAHLAGFTMHLANGRAPLLGRAVSVPALRRDGTELVVELTVRSQTLPGGRTVFVATLCP